jgi:hypothetical protein
MLLRLELYGNDFSGSLVPGLAALTRLQRLDLSHNRLSGGLAELGQLSFPNLTRVDMRNNSFTTGLIELLENISRHPNIM